MAVFIAAMIGGSLADDNRRSRNAGGKVIARGDHAGSARALRLAIALASRLALAVPLTLGYWVADRFGDIHYCLAPGHRANLRANLRQIQGEAPSPAARRAAVRRAFQHSARNFYDLLRVRHLPADVLLRQVDLVGSWDAAEEALARGSGVVFVFAHLGAFDSVLQLLPLRGYRASTIGAPAGTGLIHRAASQLRGSRGFAVEEATAGGLRRLLLALRRGEVVALAADRDFQGTGVPVRFFGAETTLPGGAVRLALASGAPLLVICCRRWGHRHTLTIEGPLPLGRGGDRQADLRHGVALVAAVLERQIGAAPEQWAIFQRVWRA